MQTSRTLLKNLTISKHSIPRRNKQLMLYAKISMYRKNLFSNHLSDPAMKALDCIFSLLCDIFSMVLLEVEQAACMSNKQEGINQSATIRRCLQQIHDSSRAACKFLHTKHSDKFKLNDGPTISPAQVQEKEKVGLKSV